MPTTISPTDTNGAVQERVPRRTGSQLAIAIDNDNFDDAHDFLIDKRDLQTLTFQLENEGVANGVSFEIYGTLEPSIIAPAFTLRKWELQNNGSGNVAALTTEIFESASYLIHVLVRLKRETPSQDTLVNILTTSGGR